MEKKEFHLGPDDTVVGMDLGSIEHKVIIKSSAGKRLTRFRITHSIEGLNELLRRAGMVRVNHGCDGKPVFAFEATGHVWEAVAHYLKEHGQRYVLVNPLATFRVREARQMGREKTDITDAGQIAELVCGGLVTRTQLDASRYHELRFAWGRRVWRHNLFKPTAGPNVAWPHPDSRRVWPGNAAVLWPVWIFFPASWRHCAKRLTIFWRVLKKPVIYKPSPVWAGFQWLD